MNTPYLNRHFKLLHTQESVKGEIELKASEVLNQYMPMILDKNFTPREKHIFIVKAMESYLTQQTAHLQQQLKEAKELLEKTTSFCEDENMYPTVYHSINQFLTRNK